MTVPSYAVAADPNMNEHTLGRTQGQSIAADVGGGWVANGELIS